MTVHNMYMACVFGLIGKSHYISYIAHCSDPARSSDPQTYNIIISVHDKRGQLIGACKDWCPLYDTAV